MYKIMVVSVMGLSLLVGGCRFLERPTSRTFEGVCIALEDDGKKLTLENTEPAVNSMTDQYVVFDLTNAKVGLAPEIGNVIRVAYLEGEGLHQALKVMNVTKQNLLEK
jgi:hypothetical protein